MTGAFTFGKKSKAELVGVHPDLVRVVKRALELSSIDFTVHDGMRTLEAQRKYVLTGTSWTMKSRHLTGHAVDLVPYINDKLRWEWPPVFTVARAMKQAAAEFGQSLRWGGVWDERLETLEEPLEDRVQEYVDARKALGKKANIDGPHFELPVELYP